MLFVPSIVQEHARSHRTLQNITVYTVVTTDSHPCDKCILHHSSCRSAVAAVAVPSQYLYYHNKRDSIPHAVLVLLGMFDNTWLKVCYRQAVRTADWEAPAQRCSKPQQAHPQLVMGRPLASSSLLFLAKLPRSASFQDRPSSEHSTLAKCTSWWMIWRACMHARPAEMLKTAKNSSFTVSRALCPRLHTVQLNSTTVGPTDAQCHQDMFV